MWEEPSNNLLERTKELLRSQKERAKRVRRGSLGWSQFVCGGWERRFGESAPDGIGVATRPDLRSGNRCRSRMLVEQEYLQEEDGRAGSEREKKTTPGEKRQLIHAMSPTDLELSALPRSISSPFSFQTHPRCPNHTISRSARHCSSSAYQKSRVLNRTLYLRMLSSLLQTAACARLHHQWV
jgi:hypothetical protein